jgi:hypothetical protein
MNPVYLLPVECAEGAHIFLRALIDNDHLWHPEDPAIDCGFEPELAALLQSRMDECWTVLNDPCETVLDILEAER